MSVHDDEVGDIEIVGEVEIEGGADGYTHRRCKRKGKQKYVQDN